MVKRAIFLMLLAVPVLAETPPLRMTMDVTGITVTGSQWVVSGKVYDTTAQGSLGTDITTNSLLACETEYGDVDIYRIDGVLSATALHLSALVSYIPDGSNAVPRIGGPTFGQAAICASFTTNGIPLTAYYGGNGLSPYLKDALNAIAIKKLSTKTGGGGGTFTGDLTGVAFVNGREASTNFSVRVDGGSWDGTSAVLSSAGTVTFAVPSQQYISDFSFSALHGTSFDSTPEYLSSTGWVTLNGTQINEAGVSTARVVVSSFGVPPPGDEVVPITLSNFVVGVFAHADVASMTNDFRGMIIRVDAGIGPQDVVNLDQMSGAVSVAVSSMSPATWANHPAISVVDCDGHPLKLDANYTFSVSNDVMNFTFQDRPIFTITGGGEATPNIVGFSIGNGTATMSVVSMRGWRPIPQWSASLTAPSWATIGSYAGSYPELVKGRHVLTFAVGTNYPCFYRVTATNETGSGVVVSFGAPVTAPSFTGVHVLTNSIGKYDLFIDENGDLCSRRTE